MSEQRAFPLHWPAGWPRTPRNKVTFSHFGRNKSGRGHSMSHATDCLLHEIKLLGGWAVVISTNVELRRDGLPRSDRRTPDDQGAAVYFTLDQKRVSLACDKWDRVECNVYAIAKHVEALRGQARWGVGSVQQAFAGYTALPEKRGPSCWEELGLAETATEEQVLAAWRQRAKEAHPDAGGSVEAFQTLSDAKDIALATIREGRERR